MHATLAQQLQQLQVDIQMQQWSMNMLIVQQGQQMSALVQQHEAQVKALALEHSRAQNLAQHYARHLAQEVQKYSGLVSMRRARRRRAHRTPLHTHGRASSGCALVSERSC